MLTARSRAYAAEGGLAYAPIVDWLRAPRLHANLHHLGSAWLSELARLMPEILDDHPDLPAPQPFTENWQRQRLYASLAHGLLVSNRPLCLILDDLQWCDPETFNWLHYFLRFSEHVGAHPYPNTRLLLLCTYRDNEIDADHPLHALLRQSWLSQQLTELTLLPLTKSETHLLAQEVASQELSDEESQRLFNETGGNPLFVVESVRAERDDATPLAALAGDQGGASLPANVYNMIQARFAQLSTCAQEMAYLAAVIGRAFRFELLAAASTHSEDDVVQGLEELWKRRILQEEGHDAYDFSHARLRDVAYAELSRLRRRVLHRRVAEALEEIHAANLDGVASQIAGHFEQAGQAEDGGPTTSCVQANKR
ncbi:MAG: hypothetical protein HC802_16510 [Caldilineaceae bacterium]|nr:hypothetical protein [Caldilineaceae bacterium]